MPYLGHFHEFFFWYDSTLPFLTEKKSEINNVKTRIHKYWRKNNKKTQNFKNGYEILLGKKIFKVAGKNCWGKIATASHTYNNIYRKVASTNMRY